MEIKCTNCGKEVSPLEIYNGDWLCPNCLKKLEENRSELKITRENEELFRQGEILYSQWLFNRDGGAELSLVERAIKLCRLSAGQGNPKALARLAYYYDKDYVGANFTEAMRVKLAYRYYKQVCFSGLADIEVEEGLPPVSWHEICVKTAQAMLFMLSHAPAEIQENKEYNVKTNLERIHSEIGMDVEFSGHIGSYYKPNVKERFFSTLISCVDKNRAPLFGAFCLRVADMAELYKRAWPGSDDEESSAIRRLLKTKKLYLSYAKKKDISAGSARFTRLSIADNFTKMEQENDANDYIWVFMFNHNGGHRYLGGAGKRNKVNTVLYGKTDATELFKDFLRYSRPAFHTFYDDDIYQYSKSKSVPEATKELLARVRNGGND